jgi:ABC-type uncharacterized transport system permease subunit
MLLVSNVPVKVLISKLDSPLQMLLLLAMGILCFLVSELGWRFSMRHYTSASS